MLLGILIPSAALSGNDLTSELTAMDGLLSSINASLTTMPSANAAATTKSICETLPVSLLAIGESARDNA